MELTFQGQIGTGKQINMVLSDSVQCYGVNKTIVGDSGEVWVRGLPEKVALS